MPAGHVPEMRDAGAGLPAERAESSERRASSLPSINGHGNDDRMHRFARSTSRVSASTDKRLTIGQSPMLSQI